MNKVSPKRIGIDFDNTIICYDSAFHTAALNKGLITSDVPVNKNQVRNYLRKIGKENEWITLQGDVYGECILEAKLFDGFVDFVRFCNHNNITIFIISHKTIYPYSGGSANLHEAAHRWLNHNGFFDLNRLAINPSNVFFELTKAEKVNRIKKMQCTHFIDDLPEFLLEPLFPKFTKRILFDPADQHFKDINELEKMKSWKDIRNYFDDQLRAE